GALELWPRTKECGTAALGCDLPKADDLSLGAKDFDLRSNTAQGGRAKRFSGFARGSLELLLKLPIPAVDAIGGGIVEEAGDLVAELLGKLVLDAGRGVAVGIGLIGRLDLDLSPGGRVEWPERFAGGDLDDLYVRFRDAGQILPADGKIDGELGQVDVNHAARAQGPSDAGDVELAEFLCSAGLELDELAGFVVGQLRGDLPLEPLGINLELCGVVVVLGEDHGGGFVELILGRI